MEVIDAPLDYNLLLGKSWTYAMCTIASSVLRVVFFPHEVKLVTVDQLNFARRGHLEMNESMEPLVDQVKPATESLGDGLYSLLMGTFDILALINYLSSMSVVNSCGN